MRKAKTPKTTKPSNHPNNKPNQVFPLPKPPIYTEPKESRGFCITLRPPEKNRFTNEDEEKRKIIDYAGSMGGYIYVVIGKEQNMRILYETNGRHEPIDKGMTREIEGYHYHVFVKTSQSNRSHRKETIQSDLMKLFSDNLVTKVSVKVKFMNPKTRDALMYTIKDGNYCYSGDIDATYIDNSIKKHMQIGTGQQEEKVYVIKQLVGEVFDILLEFCTDKNIKHCNYFKSYMDVRGLVTCDDIDLFVIGNKDFVDADYLVRYFMNETRNLSGESVTKIKEFIEHVLYNKNKFSQTKITNRYVAFDNGNILVDGVTSKVLTPSETIEVLSTYTPVRTYNENPRDDFIHPTLFYSLLKKSKKEKEIMEFLRYYIAGENNDTIKTFQLMGPSNTGKTTILRYPIYHFGIHAKKITKDGKFTFANSNGFLLIWSDELNIYQLYDLRDLSEVLLSVLDRDEDTETPYKHKTPQALTPSLMMCATNPERHDEDYTAEKNNYNTRFYNPLKNRVVNIALTELFPSGKHDKKDIIISEGPYAVWIIVTRQEIPEQTEDSEQTEDQD